MATTTSRIGFKHDWTARALQNVTRTVMYWWGRRTHVHAQDSAFARNRNSALRQRLENGETVYLVGLTPAGHNTGVSLIRVSQADGIELLANHEEERFTSKKHCMDYPAVSLDVLNKQLTQLGITFDDIHAVLLSWDYCRWVGTAVANFVGEFPQSLSLLAPEASPTFHLGTIFTGMQAPYKLQKQFGLKKVVPVIQSYHHDNHAYGAYAISPFAGSADPVLVVISDGAGDDGSISAYLAHGNELELLQKNTGYWDSLGQMYGILSSTQGGWPFLSSEGRFMGAAAWGNMNRLTNPYYSSLREIFHFGENGTISLNRSLTNWAA